MTENHDEVSRYEPVHLLWSRVMEDVGAIAKQERNDHHKYNFRGVDTVYAAVHPVLVRHQVLVIPEEILETTVTPFEARTRSGPRDAYLATVKTRYRVYGPRGDSFPMMGWGKAIDYDDKAASQAQSVAHRVCLLQALLAPTQEPDPDSRSPLSNPPAEVEERKDGRTRAQEAMELMGNHHADLIPAFQAWRDEEQVPRKFGEMTPQQGDGVADRIIAMIAAKPRQSNGQTSQPTGGGQ